MSVDSKIAEKLGAPLDAARVKSRQAGGNRPALSYLATHDVIRVANEVFGFGGWGHEVVELRQIPATEVTKDGKPGLCVGYVCTVRLTVEGCVPTSGIGYGDATEYQNSAAVTAHELAAKEAESDALKRALKNYGDQFGLALYDKQVASSGHVTGSASAANNGSSEKPATKQDETALIALIDAKNGDTDAAEAAMETARSTVNYAEWFAFQKAHWEKQPVPFKAPAGVS